MMYATASSSDVRSPIPRCATPIRRPLVCAACAVCRQALRKRHAGVLGLCSVLLAHPYDVPSTVARTIVLLAPRSSDPAPVGATVRKAVLDFKRTHQDSWLEHKAALPQEAVDALSDLLVSPHYYA